MAFSNHACVLRIRLTRIEATSYGTAFYDKCVSALACRGCQMTRPALLPEKLPIDHGVLMARFEEVRSIFIELTGILTSILKEGEGETNNLLSYSFEIKGACS